jgi:hypothetical protein
MKYIGLILICILINSSCAVAHGENIVAYCISNSKHYSIPQIITADVAIDGVSLGRDYTIKLIVESEIWSTKPDKRVTKVEGTQTKNCGGTFGGWMWFRSGNAIQARLPQDAVPGCYDVTIELYSGRSAQPQYLLDRKQLLEQFCAWSNGQPDPDERGIPSNACSLADEPEPNPTPNPTSCAPQLISPAEGAIMPNGEINSAGKCVGKPLPPWEFSWTEVPGATMYHLYVKGGSASKPAIDTDTTQSHYIDNVPGLVSSCIYDKNRLNWEWKVGAYVNGQWCESPVRHFNVAPG